MYLKVSFTRFFFIPNVASQQLLSYYLINFDRLSPRANGRRVAKLRTNEEKYGHEVLFKSYFILLLLTAYNFLSKNIIPHESILINITLSRGAVYKITETSFPLPPSPSFAINARRERDHWQIFFARRRWPWIIFKNFS